MSDTGRDAKWRYQDIKAFRFSRSLAPPLMRKMVLRGDGWMVRLKVNYQVAANARYILNIKIPDADES